MERERERKREGERKKNGRNRGTVPYGERVRASAKRTGKTKKTSQFDRLSARATNERGKGMKSARERKQPSQRLSPKPDNFRTLSSLY